MKTIDRECFCCGDKEAMARFSLGKWDIAGVGEIELGIKVCQTCGQVLQDPAPSPQIMDSYYEYYSNYTNPSDNSQPSAELANATYRQIDLLTGIKPQKAYEVGCATGFLLAELKKLGWSVSGCDPSPLAAEVARNVRGIDVQVGLFDDIPFNEEKLDLVIFSHVLEHLYNPIHALTKAYSILNGGGYLLIEVPCLINPERWGNGYFTFEHINYFSENTLKLCLNKAGFEATSIITSTDTTQYPVITILARKSDHIFNSAKYAPDFGIIEAIHLHLKNEADEWKRIDALLAKKLSATERVVIWGGGVHTSQLIANTCNLNNKEVLTILDSDAQKSGLRIGKATITHPNSYSFNPSIPIVISSKCSELEILNIIKGQDIDGLQPICLYNDFH